MTNPADSSGLQLILKLSQEIADLKARVAQIEGRRLISLELARVVTYIGGSTCTVQYPNYAAGETPASATLTGPTRVLPFAYPVYTPAVGHNVAIWNTPSWSAVWTAVSAF